MPAPAARALKAPSSPSNHAKGKNRFFTSTALARQLVAEGRATADELAEVAAAWRAWAADADGWFSVLHGEVLVRA